MMRALFIALQFLTRLPLPQGAAPGDAELAASLNFYPLVGLIIGALLAAAAMLFGHLHIPALLCAALTLALWVWLTGGLHLDGLADSFDAWASGGSRERMLAIMKDPASGPAATSALVLVLLLKFAALAALSGSGATWLLLLPPLLGRTAILLVLLSTPYVRVDGIGAAIVKGMNRRQARALTGAALLLCLLFGWPGMAALFAALVVVWWLRRHMQKTLGGATGDTLGATVEIVEAAALCALCA